MSTEVLNRGTIHVKSLDLKKIDQAYSSEPWWYDVRGFFILKFSYRSSLLRQLQLFGRNMGKQHLEVAVGSGSLLSLMLRYREWKRMPGVSITAFDYAKRMLSGARAKIGDRSDVQLHCADVSQLGFAAESFDSANIANAIHCFPNVESALHELYRVLKPGATLAVNALLYPRGRGPLAWIARKINAWGIRKGILHRPFKKEEIISALATSGFRLKWSEVQGNTLNFIAEKPAEKRKHGAAGALAQMLPQKLEYDELFSRNIGLVTREEQAKLKGATVALAGLGGVGGIYAATLARMGVGRFHIADLDAFEPANFNRQAAATVDTIGMKKTEGVRKLIHSINPEAEVVVFEGGVRADNVAEFLSGVDLMMDGLDFYALDARRLVIPEAEKRGIHVVISGPIGFTTTLHVFGPGSMAFEDYFAFNRCKSRNEMLAAFSVGLTPRLLQLGQMDLSAVNFDKQKAPSIVTSIQLCAGMACNEALQILLERRPAFLAPNYLQFDPVRMKLARGRLWFGNRGLIQRLKKHYGLMLLNRAQKAKDRQHL